TGAGNSTAEKPRLATVVPRVSSGTEMPTASASVNSELTSGRPNWVFAAKSASRCSGCGFIDMVVNSTLSVSVSVRVIACRTVVPTVSSSYHMPMRRSVIASSRLLPQPLAHALNMRLLCLSGSARGRAVRGGGHSPLEFEEAEHLTSIRHAIREICAHFPEGYWREKDSRHEFPWDFYTALAEGGWVGIA